MSLGQLNDKDKINSDADFNAKQKHEEDYTNILHAYTENLKDSLNIKSRYKKKIFWFSFCTLVGSVILVPLTILFTPKDDWFTYLSVLLPILTSFLTVFIVIPKIITEYLFNTDEEKYMSEIIKHIQNYDSENENKASK